MPLDAGKDDDIRAVMKRAGDEFGKIDFLLHSIAFASMDDLKRDTIDTSRDGFKLAMDISVYSLIAVSCAAREILAPRASILTMTYFGGEKAVPGYNVMGICKAALDASVRYLAYDLGPRGVRVNAVSAGPVRTLAGRAAGVEEMVPLYEKMSPMQRNITHEEVGRIGALLALRHVRRHHRRNRACRLRLQHHGLAGPIARCAAEGLKTKRSRGDAETRRRWSGEETLDMPSRPADQQIAVAVVEHDGKFLGGVAAAGKTVGRDFRNFPAERFWPAKRPPKPRRASAAKKPG